MHAASFPSCFSVRLILATVPDLREAGWGRIINVATGMATTPQVVMADYAAAKAAMVNSTVSLAKALAGTGVTANTVSPGVIQTEGVERVLHEAAKRLGWGDDWEIIQRRWFEDMLSDKTVKRRRLRARAERFGEIAVASRRQRLRIVAG